ncbi:MAG: 4-amino-4-deoxy-L-arabinose transferase-like glycosyltransferase [Planctomycetota bacterium]|jgi:4-amino-4-deoxy-L-arabinose transferase-like glycosyltransferase
MIIAKRSTQIIFAIVLLGFIVRLLGVFDSALPFSFYGDEVNNVERSVNFYSPTSGFDLNPHWFNKPAFGYYINFFFFGLYYLFGRFVTGEFGTSSDFATAFLNLERTGFYSIARMIQVVFGTMTIWVTYRVGKELLDRRLGYLAALLLAMAPVHVKFSHLVKNDVSSCFFATLAFLGCLKILRLGRKKDYRFTGIIMGIGFSTKYIPLLVGPVLVIAHLCRSKGEGTDKSGIRLLGICGLSLLIAAFITSPYNFLDPTYFNSTLMPTISRFQSAIFGAGENDVGGYSLTYLANFSLRMTAKTEVFSIPLTILAILGGTFGLRQLGKNKALLVLAWVVTVYLALITSSTQRVRPNHLVAVIPGLSILAGMGLLSLSTVLASLLRKRVAQVLSFILVIVLLPWPGSPTYGLVSHLRRLRDPHPQFMAYEWIQKNVPEGTTILNIGEIVPLIPSKERHQWMTTRVPFEIELSKRALVSIEERSKKAGEGDLEQLERARKHHKNRLLWWTTQEKKLTFEVNAAAVCKAKRFDSLIMLIPWQTEAEANAISAAFGYNDLWDRFPLPSIGRTREMIEALEKFPWVERYRAAATMDRTKLTKQLNMKLAVRPLAPVDFLVVSEKSYDNYVKPEEGTRDKAISIQKRRQFPSLAGFYDDLKDHYNYWEFPGDKEIEVWTIRVYDIRNRIAQGTGKSLPLSTL